MSLDREKLRQHEMRNPVDVLGNAARHLGVMNAPRWNRPEHVSAAIDLMADLIIRIQLSGIRGELLSQERLTRRTA